MNSKSLSSLKPGSKAVITGFGRHSEQEPFLQRMMEMGMTVGAEIEVAYEAPFGGAIAVRCRGSLIALRMTDAALVEVKV